MKVYFVFLIIVPCVFISCTKSTDSLNETESKNLQGTWNYAGYSGGLAGLPFTPVNAQGPYIHINGSIFQISSGDGHTQKCMHYQFVIDSARNASGIGGILILSDTSFMLPLYDEKKFLFALIDQELTLYPYDCADCFVNFYAPSSQQLNFCESVD